LECISETHNVGLICRHSCLRNFGGSMQKVDVAVVVGRFQCAQISAGQKYVLDVAQSESHKLMVFIGISPTTPDKHDPLGAETRIHMIKNVYPDALVLTIKDTKSNQEWSKNLDSAILDNIPPKASIKLYGGRNSFLSVYSGKFQMEEIEQQFNSISGTQHRNIVGLHSGKSEEFRRGVIWATQNQWNRVQMMVDVVPILIDDDGKTSIVLIRKNSDGNRIRFIGGHVEPMKVDRPINYLEKLVIKELKEESNLDVSSYHDIHYVGSFLIDDWRYKYENKAVSAFFVVNPASGTPTAGSDADDIIMMPLESFVKSEYGRIVDEHKDLVEFFRYYVRDNNLLGGSNGR
jgi:ADP-ribose pyrophosphatase YjhB (NUDIX family)